MPDHHAYVPGFDDDLFISYGHIDNASSGWVEKLQVRLQERLSQLLVGDVRIWRDLKLSGVDALWDVLRKHVSGSALFLSVLSPRYVTSDSCRKEVAWFSECIKASGIPTVDNMSRIIRVRKTPYPESDETAAFKEPETLGFSFFELNPQDDTTFTEYPADKDVDLPGYQKFYKESERLAQAVAKLLRALRKAMQPSPEKAPKKTVYLAYVTSDKAKEKQTLANSFLNKGYRVVPTEPLPASKEEIESILEHSLQACDLAVHPMGRLYGLVPEEEPQQRSIIQLQYEWIRSRSTVRQLVWIPEDLTNVEQRQIDFLSGIKDTGDKKCEFFKTALWPFITGALDELAKPQVKERRDHAKSVFLMYDQLDLETPLRKAIRKYLIDKGYPVDEPAFQGDVSMVRDLEKTSICENEAILIYYGLATDAWVQIKRKTLLKVLANTESGRTHVRAVYLCVPEDRFKRAVYLDFSGEGLPEGSGFPPLLVLGDCTPFVPEKLGPLLRQLDQDQ